TYLFNTNFAQNANVLISEFMANNNSGIKDPLDGSHYDWIELHNASAQEVNMLGWHLTDDTNNMTKWTFPAIVIQPNAYFLVWASGEADPTRFPGTTVYCNFKLSSSAGSYLALVDPNTNVILEFKGTNG